VTVPLTRAHFAIFRHQLWRKLLNRRIPCPLCGSRRACLLYKTPNVHMAIFRDIFAERVQRCESCGFVFTNPRMSADKLELYYSVNYMLEGLPVPRSLEEFLGERYKEIWFCKERDLGLILSLKKSGRLLDIGCASGTLLWLARQKGFEVKGVEVARGAADFARGVLGLDVFRGQVEEGRFRDREFDVVTMIHTLEHLPDPRRALREVHRIIADDGVLIAVVPNLASWSAQKEGAHWRWLQPGNHYSHFTPESIAQMAGGEGFLLRIGSEEGRYGEEEMRRLYDPEEIRRIYAELKGSEIVFVGRKKQACAVEHRLAQKRLSSVSEGSWPAKAIG
jgi:2-polyprenyl-3-methyl-5-hydroxy-6-metoxy-1,4-benzoquinol methylase